MKFLILIVLVSNIYAKDKNIFLDAKLDVPLSGKGTYNDGYGSTESPYYTPIGFLGIAIGYSVKLYDEFVFEPSVGYSFNTDNALFLLGSSYTYNYSDITLPIMYKKKGFKGGFFFRYMNIDTIEWGNGEYGSDRQFKNKNPYTLGIKIVTRSWFYSYEYLLNGKYSADNGRAKIDIEGSRLSIGLRIAF